MSHLREIGVLCSAHTEPKLMTIRKTITVRLSSATFGMNNSLSHNSPNLLIARDTSYACVPIDRPPRQSDRRKKKPVNLDHSDA